MLLKTKSMKHFVRVVETISDLQPAIWSIDIGHYDVPAKQVLLDTYDKLRQAVLEREAHLTLITKIMLAVFGCVPAFDTRFTQTMRRFSKRYPLAMWNKHCGFRRFNEHALDVLTQFFEHHRSTVTRWADKTRTYDFATGSLTLHHYTAAKIVDMIGFQANGEIVR